MQLTLLKKENYDDAKATILKIAHIIYAETRAASLPAVEALASMIANLCGRSMRQFSDIASDESVFECLNENSARHSDLLIAEDDSKFQMCLRVAKRMFAGTLPDSVRGAVRFHREDKMPDWAIAAGSVAEIDGLLFYKD
jgi:NADH:ubiquinone oxidoreductase subunit B-like Fe-S oxidoreductase